MKYSLHPEAWEDLREAAEFYRGQTGNELAQALFTEFEYSVSILLRHPTVGTVWRSGRRRLVMRRFPYSLVYTVVGDELRILAVAHQSRRPGYWRGRK
jgi:plasmid stabilization system protein ParE